jgi:hypothetical protein
VITPPVGGARSVLRSVVFVVGTLVGAFGTSFVVRELTAVARDSSWRPRIAGAVGLLALGLGAAALAGWRVRVVSRKWMIPRGWQAYGGSVFAAVFGLNLGMGWRTRVTSNGFWVMLLAGAAMVNATLWYFAFAVFALVRGIPILAIAWHRNRYSLFTPLADTWLMHRISKSRYVSAFERLALIAFGASLLQALLV